MKRIFAALIATSAVHFALAGPAAADDAAELYMEQAEDVLHHSCASLAAESGNDPVQIDMVVQLLVAVSLYNRELDISEFAKTDEEKTALHDKFTAAFAKGCEEDSDALLAGVVDRAVAQVLSE